MWNGNCFKKKLINIFIPPSNVLFFFPEVFNLSATQPPTRKSFVTVASYICSTCAASGASSWAAQLIGFASSLESTLVDNRTTWISLQSRCVLKPWAMAIAWPMCWPSSVGRATPIPPIAIGTWTYAITGTAGDTSWSWASAASCMRGMWATRLIEWVLARLFMSLIYKSEALLPTIELTSESQEWFDCCGCLVSMQSGAGHLRRVRDKGYLYSRQLLEELQQYEYQYVSLRAHTVLGATLWYHYIGAGILWRWQGVPQQDENPAAQVLLQSHQCTCVLLAVLLRAWVRLPT